MKIVQEQILFDCLEQFEAGAAVEDLVAQYPHLAAEIERFLAVAAQLPQLNLQPSLAAKRQSEKLFMRRAAQMRAAQHQAWLSWGGLRRALLPAAFLAMFTLLFGTTLLFTSATALPGDFLYDAKRWVEVYRQEQAGDATAVFYLTTQMNQERIREVKAILRTDAMVEVSFEGRINTRQGHNWIIAGVPVKVSEQTEVAGYVGVGALVLVSGRTQNGHLYASRIVVLADEPATPTIAPSPTPATTMTATPTPATPVIATVTPTAPATPTVNNTPTDLPTTATAVPPTPTSEPTSGPTVVVNNSDNDNDNDNDGDGNGNENSDDAPGSNNNNNDNSGDDNGNSNGSNDNRNDNDGNENNNDNDGSENDNSGDDNRNNNDDDDDNDNDDDNENDGGNSGSGGGANDNDNGGNDNDNGRRNDD